MHSITTGCLGDKISGTNTEKGGTERPGGRKTGLAHTLYPYPVTSGFYFPEVLPKRNDRKFCKTQQTKLHILSMIQGACGLGVGSTQTAEEVQPPGMPGSSQNPSKPVLYQHHPLNGTVSHGRVNFVKMRKYTDVDDHKDEEIHRCGRWESSALTQHLHSTDLPDVPGSKVASIFLLK